MEPSNASALSTATDVPTAHTSTATDVSTETTTGAARRAIRLIRQLVGINLGLVALQPISAGLFLSGYARAAAIHAVVGLALQLAALVQVVIAIVLWRRRRVPASVASMSIGLFLIVFIQNGLGYNKWYWLHVPIGVGIFGGLIRQTIKLDTLWRGTGAES